MKKFEAILLLIGKNPEAFILGWLSAIVGIIFSFFVVLLFKCFGP